MFPGGSAPPRSTFVEPLPAITALILRLLAGYDGPRETRDIIAAATGNMPTFVKRAGTAAEVAELREKASLSLSHLVSSR